MRKHLDDYLLSPFTLFLAALLLLLILLIVLLFSPIGIKIIASTADSSLEELTINGISGSLFSGLHIDEITWSDGDSISLKNVDLKLQKLNLKKGRLVAEKVKAERLSINLSEVSSGETITSLPNFGLPLNMNAHLIQLDSLRITQDIPDDPGSRTLLFQIKNIQLKKVTISDNYLRFRRLQGKPIILDQALEINVTEGRLNMNQPHEIKTSGEISYQHPSLGEAHGNIDLDGTLTNYNFKGELNHQQKILGEQKVSFTGQGDYRRVHLEDINLTGPHGKINAKGRIVWQPDIYWAFLVKGSELSTDKYLPDWPMTVDTELRVSGTYTNSHLENIIDIASLSGQYQNNSLSLTGRIYEREGVIRTEDINLALGDNQLQFSGRADEPLNLNWEIKANKIKQLLPKHLSHLKLDGIVNGKGKLKGFLQKPELKIDLTIQDINYDAFSQGSIPITLKGDVFINDNNAVIDQLFAKSGDNTLTVSGTASEPFKLKLKIDAQNIQQISPQLMGNIKGMGIVKGSFEKSAIYLNIIANKLSYKTLDNVYKQGKEPISIDGRLTLNKKVIQLKKLVANIATNNASFSGQIAPKLNIQFAINAPQLNKVSANISGLLKGKGELTGSLKAPIITSQLTTEKFTYNNSPLINAQLKTSSEIHIVNGNPIIKDLIAQAGSNKLQISGKADSPYNLKWALDGNNLKELIPTLSGTISAQGKLQGSTEKPIINTTLNIDKLRYKDTTLESVNLIAQTKNNVYHIIGNLNKLQIADQKINNAKLSIDGKINNHSINLTSDHDAANIRFKAKGSWLKQQWNGVIQQAAINNTQTGNWQLQQATPLSLSKNSFSANRFCFKNKETSACSNKASWSKNTGLALKGSLNKTPLSLFQPWLPKDVELNGTVSGQYDVTHHNGIPRGIIKFKFPDSTFSITDSENEKQIFTYSGAELTSNIANKTIKTTAQANILERGKISSNLTINLSPENGRHTINGKAEFNSPNINWAQEHIPHSRGLRGQLTSKITFSGLINKPKIIGTARLKKGYLRLPEAGTELTNIDINITANKPNKAIIKGSMRMGKGQLAVAGNLDIKTLDKWKARINIKGNNILFMNTNEIQASMSPNLHFGITKNVVTIKGNVIIPQANINLKEIPEASIDETSDAIIVNQDSLEEKTSPTKIKPDILIELGDKVKLNAFGLKANLAGKVDISHNQNDILANGSLRVTKGKYKAYGQNLEINNGRLIFNGSPKLVGMDIRATRTVDETTVGVHLGGTLSSPRSSIFSNPTLPESEALSFLITGHSLSTSSGQESALLMSAVRGLGITGSNSLIHKIGSSLGLDDVNIVTNEDFKKSELSLGKRLGSRLYVKYLVGLFDQTKKIAIEYKFNKFLSLEAQTTSKSNGLDFIYEIERD